MSVLLIAEITVSGLLTLKKAAAAVPMMLPLIIITVSQILSTSAELGPVAAPSDLSPTSVYP